MKPRGILKYNPKKHKYMAMAMMYETAEAKQFKKNMVQLIKKEVDKQKFKVDNTDTFVLIEWTWFFPSIKNDTNNRFKCAIDAVTEFGDIYTDLKIWNDDNLSMNIDKRIYYDSKKPRVELKIWQSSFIGVFDDKQDLNKFVNTYCNNCTKGKKIGQKGGCSIYKKALESRIQDDLHIDFNTGEKKCLKFKVKK